MASVEDGLQAQIRNIEAIYGKTMPEWFALISRSGKTKHTDVVAWLKGEYGMTHGAAHRVSLLARAAEAPHDDTGDPTAALYTGKKAAARPIHATWDRSARGPQPPVLESRRRPGSVRARCGCG